MHKETYGESLTASVEAIDPSKQPLNLLGHIAWLWINSPLHKSWPIELLGNNVIAPIHHKQFLLLKQEEMPVAYCSWAFLDLAAEKKYLTDANSLTLDKWAGGDRMWLIDWVAPFGHSFALYKKMREKFPNNIARAIRIDADKKTARIQEIRGKAVPKAKADKVLQEYFKQINEQHLNA